MTRMRGVGTLVREPWLVAVVAVGGLLIAIIISGLVGLSLNQSIKDAVETSLGYDVELEDLGQDLTRSAFRLREAHRALAIDGPAPDRVTAFEDAYQTVRDAIDRLDNLGIHDPSVAQPDQLRALAATYYKTFRPAIPLYTPDLLAYERISDRSLAILDELDREIQPIDKLGEQHFRAGLRSVEREAASAGLVLLWVVGGLVLIGTVLAFAAVRMVGELRGLYARERASADTLARAAQAKTDFLADVAHELRTPLTVLRTNADVGLSLDRDGPQAPLLREIVGESVRMDRLLQDLLFLASSETTELPLDREPVAVSSFINEVAVRAQTLAREGGARLELNLSTGGRLLIDRARVEQVILILVDNAVKYSAPDSCVTLSTTVTSHQACVEVADRGFGIPEDELPYVFDRFYRADRLKPRIRKLDGAGLGLSIARTIVEAHGGHIGAASRPGGGTCVTVCLPLIRADSRA